MDLSKCIHSKSINKNDHPLSFIPLNDAVGILKKKAEFHGFKESKDYSVVLGGRTCNKYVKNGEYNKTFLWIDENDFGLLNIEVFWNEDDSLKIREPLFSFKGFAYSESDFDVILKSLNIE